MKAIRPLLSNFKIRTFLLLCLAISSSLTCTWERDYKEAARLSFQPDTELILVPYPHGIFDAFEKDRTHFANYKKTKLKQILEKESIQNPLLWEKFNKEPETDDLELEVKYTSHYTNYSYDTKIPLVFYGPNFFRTGNYSDEIDQEQIVPIIANLLDLDSIKSPFASKLLKKESHRPRLIVTLVIDQGGKMVLDQEPSTFPFLNKMQKESAVFNRAQVNHLEAHTAVGHSAIGTGAYPKDTGVFSNEVYFWKNGKVSRKPIYEPVQQVWNLAELKVDTLADRLSKSNEYRSIIISHCYAPRASIGMAGHGGKGHFVSWADKKSGKWSTEPAFYQLSPQISKESFYSYYQRNSSLWKRDFQFKDENDFLSNLGEFQASSLQVKLDEEAFLTTLQSEILDKNLQNDQYPDLAYLTLKATDAIGHQFGWESEEAKEVQLETDRSIERIFQFLKKNYGNDFVLIITADHGAAVMPELSGVSKLSHTEFFTQLSMLIPEKYRAEDSVVKWVTHSQVALDHEIMKRYKISEDQIIDVLCKIQDENGRPFFRKIWRRRDIE